MVNPGEKFNNFIYYSNNTMRYVYLKLGNSNSHLKYCLQIGFNNIFKKRIAYIFFGKITTDRLKSLIDLNSKDIKSLRTEDKKIPTYNNLQNQIRPFIEAGKNRDVKFISIYKNILYMFEPDSEVFDMPMERINEFCTDLREKTDVEENYINQIENDIPKVMYIKNCEVFKNDIPYVLRTINVIQYFNRNTCREIKVDKYWEIILALKTILNEEVDLSEKITPQQLFKLLSPHQFETLIFLILTNANLFSPAWRAGSLPDIDVVGINYYNSDIITIGTNPTIKFEKNKEVNFQVKRKEVKKKEIKSSENIDYFITLNPSTNERIDRELKSDWLLNVVENQLKTRKWVEHSLKWVLKNTSVNSVFDLLK